MNQDSESRFIIPTSRGKSRINQLVDFAKYILSVQSRIDFKLSSRGWCYQLEGFGVINKGEFNKVQRIINECRKKGILPIDFVAEESSRRFSNVLYPTEKSPQEFLKSYIQHVLDASSFYDLDFWENEEYYIQMLVEKIDLVTLFEPICEKYYVPIANTVGWSSILQRANMVRRFKEMEKRGLIPVLLYCGDHDPFGLAISDFLSRNLDDIQLGTRWNPENLIIDRFGLNYDFIIKHDLTWIDNLTTGSGKSADLKNPIVSKYVEQFGIRKVEANAIVVIPEIARELCEKAILKYLGEEVNSRYEEKQKELEDKFEKIMESTGIKEPLLESLELLEDYQEEEE